MKEIGLKSQIFPFSRPIRPVRPSNEHVEQSNKSGAEMSRIMGEEEFCRLSSSHCLQIRFLDLRLTMDGCHESGLLPGYGYDGLWPKTDFQIIAI